MHDALALDIVTTCAIWEIDGEAVRLLLLDEPDTHLHPELQQRLADFLVTIADTYAVQMLVATHSTTLLAALGQRSGTRTSLIYLNPEVEEQRAAPFNAALQELTTCLGGHALMGPLVGAPLLLVEGDDDFEIWSQVARTRSRGLAVIPCGSWSEVRRYQQTLERIFGNLLSTGGSHPSGFALEDGDQGERNPPQPTLENSQQHVRFLQLECHESENLYLADEVLACIGTDWEQAKATILNRCNEFGPDRAEILCSVDEWDRQRTDVKNVIREIAQIVDPKNIRWTLRLGQCLRRVRPIGQIAAFLGGQVVEAIWGNPSQT